MSDWQTTELGQLAEFRNGLNYSAANAGTGVAVVGVSDFQDKSFVDFTTLAELDLSALTTPDAMIRKDDILFVRSNGNRELIGRSLLVLSDPPKPTSHSGFTIRLRFTDKRADPRFFAYLLRGGAIRRHLSNQGGGTNINNLNQGILSRLIVPLPPLEIQRRIAGILGAYDDLIEANRRRIAVLEEMARGLFTEWFTRLRFPGHEDVAIKDTPDGPLPAGWGWGRFADLAAEVRDTVSPDAVDPRLPYVGLEHISRRSTTLAEYGAAADVSSLKARFRRGDILFGKIRPYFHKVAWAPFDGVASTDAIIWRPTPGLAAQALLQASDDAFVAHSVQTSNGTKMPRANNKVLAEYRCALAPSNIADRFEKTAGPMIESAAGLQAANTNLTAARDLLLPRLISGQLSVTQAKLELEAA